MLSVCSLLYESEGKVCDNQWCSEWIISRPCCDDRESVYLVLGWRCMLMCRLRFGSNTIPANEIKKKIECDNNTSRQQCAYSLASWCEVSCRNDIWLAESVMTFDSAAEGYFSLCILYVICNVHVFHIKSWIRCHSSIWMCANLSRLKLRYVSTMRELIRSIRMYRKCAIPSHDEYDISATETACGNNALCTNWILY